MENPDINQLIMRPIGDVISPYMGQIGTPIQAVYGEQVNAVIQIYEAYRDRLADLDGFERIWLICWLDRSVDYDLMVIPYRDTQTRGVFSTRAPRRPNPIGLSCVEIVDVDKISGKIRINSVDLLHGTPVLDIKPYIPQVDSFPSSKAGWFEHGNDTRLADKRFENNRGKNDN